VDKARLSIEIPVYNRAMEYASRLASGKSGLLSECQHCGRKYAICCICDKAKEDWNNMILEVRGVAEAIESDIADDDKGGY
jgi:hypothetical protein